jgi:hypothetical protein
MSNNTSKAIAELLAPMLKKTLFVAINSIAAPANAIEPHVAEHLADMNALEAQGRLWASGQCSGPRARRCRQVLCPVFPDALVSRGIGEEIPTTADV